MIAKGTLADIPCRDAEKRQSEVEFYPTNKHTSRITVSNFSARRSSYGNDTQLLKKAKHCYSFSVEVLETEGM